MAIGKSPSRIAGQVMRVNHCLQKKRLARVDNLKLLRLIFGLDMAILTRLGVLDVAH